MHPFFSVFGVQISAFATMAVVAGAVAFVMLLVSVRGSDLKHHAINYFFIALCGALVGAWLLYALVNLPRLLVLWPQIRETMPLNEALTMAVRLLGGAVFYGGLLGGLLAMWLYAKVYKTPLLPYLDIFAPIVAVAHAIGRVGCFLAGCCYGRQLPPNHLLAVIYPPASLAAPHGVTLLAVPLIESALNLLIAAGLMALMKLRGSKIKPGTVAALYMMLYATIRFVLEFFRGDVVRGGFWVMSTSQWISAGLFAAAMALLICLRKKM